MPRRLARLCDFALLLLGGSVEVPDLVLARPWQQRDLLLPEHVPVGTRVRPTPDAAESHSAITAADRKTDQMYCGSASTPGFRRITVYSWEMTRPSSPSGITPMALFTALMWLTTMSPTWESCTRL